MIDTEGLVVPLTTPFDKYNKIDEKALTDHIKWLEKNGVSRLLVNGTTAEFFSLIPAERRELLILCRKAFKGKIYFNTASDSLLQALEAVKWAEGEGADAVVAMAPYYFADAPSEGLVKFFNTVGSSTSLPLILYNFARHTNNPITAEMLKDIPHSGIKDSSGDLSLIGATPCYLAGTSSAIVNAFEKGAKGFVSAAANWLPDLYVEIEEFLKKRSFSEAQRAQEAINEKRKELACSNEISGIKKVLAGKINGYPENVRLPLVS